MHFFLFSKLSRDGCISAASFVLNYEILKSSFLQNEWVCVRLHYRATFLIIERRNCTKLDLKTNYEKLWKIMEENFKYLLSFKWRVNVNMNPSPFQISFYSISTALIKTKPFFKIFKKFYAQKFCKRDRKTRKTLTKIQKHLENRFKFKSNSKSLETRNL